MSSINSIGSGMNQGSMSMMQGMRAMRKPDPAEMADNLFSKLDTSGQGYLEKTDLQAAFDSISTGTDNATNVDNLFAQLDSDSDGKVTKEEFSSKLQALADQLDAQFQSMRMQGGMQGMGAMGGMGGMGGMPPPPPPQDDAGFTKDELQSQLNEIGTTDSKRSSLISSVIQNFDKADTDGDGKVSFREAMTYAQSSNSAEASSSTTNTTSTTASSDTDAKLMMQIMRLMQAYSVGNEDKASATLSVSA